jgi:hypothetical protein
MRSPSYLPATSPRPASSRRQGRHCRGSGNPVFFDSRTMDPRVRGDDERWCEPGTIYLRTPKVVIPRKREPIGLCQPHDRSSRSPGDERWCEPGTLFADNKGRHSRRSGNPLFFDSRTLDPRVRGDDERWCEPGTLFADAKGRHSRGSGNPLFFDTPPIALDRYQAPTIRIIGSAIPGVHPSTGAGLRKPAGPGNGAVNPPASSIRSKLAMASHALSDSSINAS